jgi:hypothetical protein
MELSCIAVSGKWKFDSGMVEGHLFMEEYERMNDINVHDGRGRLDMCA